MYSSHRFVPVVLTLLALSACTKEGDKTAETAVSPTPPAQVTPAPTLPAPTEAAADAAAGAITQGIVGPARMKRMAEAPMPVLPPDQEPPEQYDSRYGWYPVPPPLPPAQEKYAAEPEAAPKLVAVEPVSTFAVDVDTGSYANMRRYLNNGLVPPLASVRVEEWLNYFKYEYAPPATRDVPFSVSTEVAKTPWNKDSYLLKVGLRGYDVARAERPPANLVFLLDISGSMNQPDKLPLMITGMKMLADALTAQDRVAIVTYAGETGVALSSTRVDTVGRKKIRAALDALGAGGSTAGEAGLQLAYAEAQKGFVRDGINRVILATDGDFNVGISDQKELEKIIEAKRKSGIALSTLGFGEGNYREDIMEHIADVGNGNYAYIDSATEAQRVLSDELTSTLLTIAQDVKIQIEFNPEIVGEYRLIGYENRALAREDFNDDKKDAGDIGAGHMVTALYEVTPLAATRRKVDPLRFGKKPDAAVASRPDEFAFLRLRYKLPGSKGSILLEQPIKSAALTSAALPTGDMAFAASVAAFAQKIKGGTYLGKYGFDEIAELARSGSQKDSSRTEFVRLVTIAKALRKESAAR